MGNIPLRNFSRGEVSPAFYGRTDTAAYQSGVKKLLNAYVMRTGGLISRPGTIYKGATKSNGAARIVPCVFDDDQNYLLEFGNNYVRFWKDGAQVTVSGVSAWVTATAYTAGQVRSNGGTNYVCIGDHTSAAGTEPGVGASWQTVWYALTGTTYELPTSYGSSILRELQFAATLGVLRVTHNTVALHKLVRVANTEWYFAALVSAPTLDFPENLATDAAAGSDVSYVVTAYDSVNGIESLASAAVSGTPEPSVADTHTQTWDPVTGATSYRVYRSIGGSVYGFVREVTATTWADNGSALADDTRNPPEQVTDLSSSGDYPGVIGAYQQRIFVSGSVNSPDFVRASKSASPDDFTVSSPLTDADAVSYRILGARVVRPLHFLEVARRLIQFANVGEYVIEGDDAGIITPSAVNPRLLSANGAAAYPAPLPVNDSALYVQARGAVVRDLLPNSDGVAGSDLTVLAAHLVDGYSIVEWCYQQTPHSVVWCVRSDGALLSLTYVREAGVFAWAKHTTDGTFESVACVDEGDEDAVYVIANRTINAGTVRYLERFANRADDWPAGVHVDCASVQTPGGGTGTIITGLGHLEGESVCVVGRDNLGSANASATILASPLNTTRYPNTYTVALSQIASSDTELQGYDSVVVGLPFVVDVQTLDLDTVSGKSVRDGAFLVTRVGIWLEDALNLYAGYGPPASATALTNLQPVVMVDEDENAITTAKTGYAEVQIEGRWSRSGSIFLRVVDPVAVTIHALIPYGTFPR